MRLNLRVKRAADDRKLQSAADLDYLDVHGDQSGIFQFARFSMWENAVHNVAVFLSGGFAVGVLNWLRDTNRDRTVRHVAHLTDQLRTLYGPLSYLASQNESLSKLNDGHNHAYTQVYTSQSWSDDPRTRDSLQADTNAVIDLMNQYTNKMRQNNDRMIQIIEQNYAMADPEDLEAFQAFATEWLRGKTEFADGKPKVPRSFYSVIESVAFYRQEFANRIRNQCAAKTAELRRLRTLPRWWKFSQKRSEVSDPARAPVEDLHS